MIDRTTLPVSRNGLTWTVGQRFTISGTGFDYWPSEIVLDDSVSHVENGVLGEGTLLKVVSKSNTELVFEVQADYSFTSSHVWQYFGTPFIGPREILEYRDM